MEASQKCKLFNYRNEKYIAELGELLRRSDHEVLTLAILMRVKEIVESRMLKAKGPKLRLKK